VTLVSVTSVIVNGTCPPFALTSVPCFSSTSNQALSSYLVLDGEKLTFTV
jgi:hypothetical protein